MFIVCTFLAARGSSCPSNTWICLVVNSRYNRDHCSDKGEEGRRRKDRERGGKGETEGRTKICTTQ